MREPYGAHEGHEWTYLVGTNWQGIKEWPNGGFYRTDGAKGSAILEALSRTADEWQYPPLPILDTTQREAVQHHD